MNIYSQEGIKIIFTADSGYDMEIEEAKKILSLNSIYTVSHIEVYDWSSYVILKEFPNKKFNTCIFENIKTEKE